MHHKIVAALLGALVLGSSAARDDPIPTVVQPESLQWFGPPDNPSVRGAWVVGAEDRKALYALRVRIAEGGRIAPHTHPDTRFTTVLRGTVHVGYGWTADDHRMVAMTPGTVYVVPAGSPHYLWARDGEVEYQESGFGPTGMDFEPPPEPNSKRRSWRTP
jgi:quercetin dioxygenase-like cupin family protein